MNIAVARKSAFSVQKLKEKL